ncbi:MAG: TetR/AcrR family transcriptional regulator [Granulosicoccus sp.]
MARPRATDYQDKRRAILDSAAAVISDIGIDKASMSRIASGGQLSKATLYHYYSGKDALIFDLVCVHLTELDTELKLTDNPALAPELRLQKLVERTLRFYKETENYHKVQLNIAGVLAEEQMKQVRIIERRIVKRFSALLSTINPKLAQDNKRLKPVTMSLFGMLNWAYTWFREDGELSREDYAKMVTNLLLLGIQSIGD